MKVAAPKSPVPCKIVVCMMAWSNSHEEHQLADLLASAGSFQFSDNIY